MMRPNTHIPTAFLITIACAAMTQLAGCAPREGDSRTVTISEAYGTLEFTGTVEQIDRGSEYEFRTAIDATFRPEAEINRVREVRLQNYFLAANVPTDPGQPARSLYRDDQTIDVQLSEEGQTVRLPELTFRLSKDAADRADHLDLGVSGGGILWPVVDLK